MTQEQQTVAIHIPGEQVGKVTPLYEEWSRVRDTTLEEAHQSVDRAIKLTEVRTSFFEKLILLATGSFALSLTFLGTLHRHTEQGSPLAALGCLKAAWVLMLICVLFGWFHNLYRCASIERLSCAVSKTLLGSRFAITQNFMARASSIFKESQAEEINLGEFFRLAAAQMQELSKEALKQMQQFSDDSRVISRYADWLGNIAMLAIMVAFILLVTFAIKNAALL